MRAYPWVLTIGCLAATPRLAAQQPAAGDPSRQPFVIERHYEDDRFEADGRSRTAIHVRVRVQTELGLRAFGQLAFAYDSATQRLEVDTVRVFKADGTTVLAPASAVLDLTGPIGQEAPVYSSLRQKVVTVPGLRPGDTLEFHLTWTTHTPLAAGHFWYATRFPRDAIVLDQRLTVSVPRASEVRVKTTGTADPAVTETGDRRTWVWRHANRTLDTAAIARAARAGAQPFDVQLSTYRSWDEVGAWYAGLERDREAVTPAIRARADSLVRGRTSLLDSVAAIYDYVALNTRYVSLSFGVGRYQPHLAAEVLANQYGDCKDKHALLAALLRAIGVPSAPVLIASDRAHIDPDVPSPIQFDHLITFVQAGRDSVWLDATPAVAPFRFLLTNLRDQPALVIPLDGAARLVRTPAEPPFPQFEQLVIASRLSDSGRLTGTYTYRVRDDGEVLLREAFRTIPADQVGAAGQQIARAANLDGTVSDVTIGDPSSTREPFQFGFRLDRAGAVRWNGLRASLTLPLPALTPGSSDERGAQDTIALGLVGDQTQRLTLELPAGVTVRLPIPVSLARDYGEYRSTYRVQGRVLTVERLLRLRRRDLPPDRGGDYDAFRQALIDDQNQQAALTRTTEPRATEGSSDVAELYQAGLDAYEAGNSLRARTLLRRVVTADPQHRLAWNELGRAYMATGELDSAIAAFQRQNAINPYSPFAHNNLGLALWRLGRRAEAADAFRRQITVSPLDRRAHANLGRLAIEMGHDSEAVAELQTAMSVSPDNPTLAVDLGRAHLAAGRADQALAQFERAVAATPEAWMLNNVAYALAERGVHLERAEQWARTAIESVSTMLRTVSLDSVDDRSSLAVLSLGHYWDTLGWVLFRRGDAAGAERFVRAAWLLTFTGTVGDHLARVLERLGRSRDAQRQRSLVRDGVGYRPDSAGVTAPRATTPHRAPTAVETSARAALLELRTSQLGRLIRSSVSGEVAVLLGPGGVVEDVRFRDGPAVLRQLEPAIRRTTFPQAVPEGAGVRLPRRAMVSCSGADGECILLLFEAGSIAVERSTEP